MANRNNSHVYCRQINDMVNSRFVDAISAEYRYLFELIPVSNNPDTDIQRILCGRVGEYQTQHHIRITREFIMEHEVIMLAKFMTNQIMNHRVENQQHVLENLIQQINPNEQLDAQVNVVGGVVGGAAVGVAAGNDHVDNIWPQNIIHADIDNDDNNDNDINDNIDNIDDNIDPVVNHDNFIANVVNHMAIGNMAIGNMAIGNNNANNDDDDIALNNVVANIIGNNDDMADIEPNADVPIVDEPVIFEDEEPDNSDSDADNSDDASDDEVVINVGNNANNDAQEGEFNFQQVRDILARGIDTDGDRSVITGFKDYVRRLVLNIGGATTDWGSEEMPELADEPINEAAPNAAAHNADDMVIADIIELAGMELEINYDENIPVHIEFPKEPVSDDILNWVGPKISNHSVGRYRAATNIVRIDAILVADGVVSIAGVNLQRDQFVKLLMLLSPTFAYNLTHAKFVDKPLILDLAPQLDTAFMQNFSNYYGSNLFSDCALCVSGYTFYAHKIILANESELFDGYYAGEWGRGDCITKPFVIEADAHLFGKILDFVYTRKLSCSNSGEIVDLYAIADAYRFKKLLTALDMHINPVIQIAIKRRLYENHPRANVDNTILMTHEAPIAEPPQQPDMGVMEEVD